jgi:hypothetical protein|tara:strand:- start:257 stop:505 length:249 start_codon:yes stop_codon:yes gene_type:complete
MINDLKKVESLLEECLLLRSERYKLIQDMTISATKAAGIIKGIKLLNLEISSYQNQINEIKEQIGYHQDEIKKTELKKKTII